MDSPSGHILTHHSRREIFEDVQSMVSTIDSEFVGLVKMLNFALNELPVTKCEFVQLFLCFLFIKSDFTEVFSFLHTCKHIFGSEYTAWQDSVFPGTEGGTQVLAGLAPPILTVGSLMRTPGCQSRLQNFCIK